MPEAAPVYIAGVFQDAAWARRGLEALVRDGFPPDTLSVLAAGSDQVQAIFGDVLRHEPRVIEIPDVGPVTAGGPLVAALEGGDDGLARLGLVPTMRRAGFQVHDGQIFQRLIARGGVLAAVLSEPRASDALARLHSFGAGNAAIGAWTGRV